MTIGLPYPDDPVPKDSLVCPKGSYIFLPVRLRIGGSVLPADNDAYQRIDFYQLKDPDNNVIHYETSALDPSDGTDVYSSASPDYAGLASIRQVTNGVTTALSTAFTSATAAFNNNDVGKPVINANIPSGTTIATVTNATTVVLSTQATASGSGLTVTIGRENTGLFAQGYPGAPTGRFALKILVPTTAEETVLSSTRRYRINWGIKKNGVLVTDGEYFNVGPAGVLLFGGSFITVDMVTAGIYTRLDPTSIQALIDEAVTWARGRLRTSGFDPDSITDGTPEQVITAVLLYTRALVFERDASAGFKRPDMQEGTKRIKLAGQSSADMENLRKRAMEELKDFINIFGSRYKAQLKVFRRHYGTNPYQGDGKFDS